MDSSGGFFKKKKETAEGKHCACTRAKIGVKKKHYPCFFPHRSMLYRKRKKNRMMKKECHIPKRWLSQLSPIPTHLPIKNNRFPSHTPPPTPRRSPSHTYAPHPTSHNLVTPTSHLFLSMLPPDSLPYPATTSRTRPDRRKRRSWTLTKFTRFGEIGNTGGVRRDQRELAKGKTNTLQKECAPSGNMGRAPKVAREGSVRI